MKKSILKLKTVKELTQSEQKQIKGGIAKDWFKCCLTQEAIDNNEDIPFGCEAWLICDGWY
ncbi:MAG: hypothetical protein QM535_10190 [Limnohabitans sp.]|nr:hypothetical protein [Limnohabitans sp.]